MIQHSIISLGIEQFGFLMDIQNLKNAVIQIVQ